MGIKSNKQVEIILAMHNGEKYLREQLDSIFAQSFQDFILTVSDDASADKSCDTVNEYIKLYPDRIRLVRNTKALGAGENFLSRLEESEAGYIMFCDQDDVWLPHKLEKTFLRMQKLEKRYGRDCPLLVYSELKVVDEELNLLSPCFSELNRMRTDGKLAGLLVENQATGNTIMINTALKNAYRKPENYIMHDWWLALTAAAAGRLSFIKEPLTLYRQHGGNVLGAGNAFSVQGFLKRLKRGAEVRENYRLIMSQAEELHRLYSECMPENRRKLLEAFIDIKGRNRLSKIAGIIRGRFYKGSLIMTLGEMFGI